VCHVDLCEATCIPSSDSGTSTVLYDVVTRGNGVCEIVYSLNTYASVYTGTVKKKTHPTAQPMV